MLICEENQAIKVHSLDNILTRRCGLVVKMACVLHSSILSYTAMCLSESEANSNMPGPICSRQLDALGAGFRLAKQTPYYHIQQRNKESKINFLYKDKSSFNYV